MAILYGDGPDATGISYPYENNGWKLIASDKFYELWSDYTDHDTHIWGEWYYLDGKTGKWIRYYRQAHHIGPHIGIYVDGADWGPNVSDQPRAFRLDYMSGPHGKGFTSLGKRCKQRSWWSNPRLKAGQQ